MHSIVVVVVVVVVDIVMKIKMEEKKKGTQKLSYPENNYTDAKFD